MSDRHRQSLALRRRELVERSAAQRAALINGVAPLLEKVAVVDRAVGSVRRYPLVSAGIAAGVMLLGWRRLFGLLVRGLTLYSLLRKA